MACESQLRVCGHKHVMCVGLMDRVRCILLTVAGLRLNGARAKQLDQELEYVDTYIVF